MHPDEHYKPPKMHLSKYMWTQHIKNRFDKEADYFKSKFMLKWNDIMQEYPPPHISVKEPLEDIIEFWKIFRRSADEEVLNSEDDEKSKRETLISHLNLLYELEKITIEDFIYFLFKFDN